MTQRRLLFSLRIFVLLAGLTALSLIRGVDRPPSAEAAGAELGSLSASCASGANVTFNWTPVIGAWGQWLDLSILNNGFAPDTFIGHGPLPPDTGSAMWPGLAPGVRHYWRVNSLTEAGWVTSATGSFIPCGSAPALINAFVSCVDTVSADVTVRWAPAVGIGGAQWVDIGTDAEFGHLGFTGTGPLADGVASYTFRMQADLTYYYRINAFGGDGLWHTSDVGTIRPRCGLTTALYGSSDRLVYNRLGINATVNVRDVLKDGALGNPAGAYDVVRYNFSYFGFNGYPGQGGTTLIAGHIDFYSVGAAVFYPLRSAQVGDLIQYERGDGVVVAYVVQWIADVPPSYDWGSLASSRQDAIALITCIGTFDRTIRQYDLRRIVYAVPAGI